MAASATPSAPRSVNPATGELLAEWPWLDDAGLEAALAGAQTAARSWRQSPIPERAARLTAAAGLLRERKAVLAREITLEMGKPLAEAEAEVEKSAVNCDVVAARGPGWLADEVVDGPGSRTHLSFLPIGPVLSVLPWNFPVWQIFRCVASANPRR